MALMMQARTRVTKKSEESQKVLDALDEYLESNFEEPMRWLVHFWKDQATVMLYKDLRELVVGETEPEDYFDTWFQDYSKVLADKMTPEWEAAFMQGWNNMSELKGIPLESGSEVWVRDWIRNRTGNLVTNCTETQVKAIRYLIAECQSQHMGSAETARYIRPTIGLTEDQAAANLRYYNNVKEKLQKDHPRMKPETIEQRARTSAARYAEKQQRSRAETIARTEIAQAYNNGTDSYIREAIRQERMPKMAKEWSTALDGHVCPACQALEGTAIGMDEEFKTKSGRKEVTVLLPPLHPRCKCAVKYVEVKDENI